MKDYSKNLSVRMTEEQFQRLERYRGMTRFGIGLYFQKLICEEQIKVRLSPLERDLHAAVNMLHSNIMQITRCPRAKELDAETVAKLKFLIDLTCEQVCCVTFQE